MITVKPLPNQEALEFWDAKVQLGPAEFKKLSAEARLMAFAASGIAKGDELATVYAALRKSMDAGISYGQFLEECREIFERRGWTGKRAWRVDNIYRTNIQTAYNVGRYRQMMEVADERPYWMYDAVNDSRTRPTHRALDGKVYPANHPFWNNWYPPNGYRCRCGVVSYSAAQVRARGLRVETDDPTNTYIHPINPVTGQPDPVPVQLLPDPGFAYHPGRSVWGGLVDDAMRKRDALRQYADLLGHADYRLPSAQKLKNLDPLPGLLPSLAELKGGGMSNRQAANFYLDEFRKEFGLEEGGTDVVFVVAGEQVIVSDRLVTGAGGRMKITKGDRGQYIPLFRKTVADPDEIWLTPMRNDQGMVVLRRRHLTFWRGDGENVAGFCVLDVDRGVWSGVTVYDVAAGQADHDGESLLDGPAGYRRGVLLKRKQKR